MLRFWIGDDRNYGGSAVRADLVDAPQRIADIEALLQLQPFWLPRQSFLIRTKTAAVVLRVFLPIIWIAVRTGIEGVSIEV
jgi:hypothetical protein